MGAKIVIWEHEEVLEVLRERWSDQQAAEKEPIVVVHKCTDIDELSCLWLLATFVVAWCKRIANGIKAFLVGKENPGIRFILWGGGNLELPLGHTAAEWEEKGVLAIGTWGGRLDEHTPEGPRRKDECSATLTAKALGAHDDPALRGLLHYVYDRDTTPARTVGDVASLVKRLTDEPGNFLEALRVVSAFCGTTYDGKLKRVTFSEVDYDELSAKKEMEFIGPNGYPMKAVLLTTANPQAVGVAWSRGTALVVLRNPDGHTVIFWNKRLPPADFVAIARAIRVEEFRAQGKPLPANTFLFSKVGVVSEVPEWFLPDFDLEHRNMLANGTKTHPDVPVTHLTGERIMKIVTEILNPNSWEPGFALRCKEGFCGSGRNGKPVCPRKPRHDPKCDACRMEPVVEMKDVPKASVLVLVAKPASATNGQTQTEALAPQKVLDVTPSM